MSKDRLTDQELAERVKHEHQVVAELSRIIREHLAVVPEQSRGAWLDGFRAAFTRLRTHLQESLAARETNGYLEDVTQRRPTLSGQVERLRAEHPQLLHMAARIHDELQSVTPEQGLLLGDLAARTLRFLAINGQHDQRENMITLFACSQDIGAGD
ncbi:MAG TPA: hemerythrin domain-containing protein [Phycisphaerae bacterium]|nr:hemerythrin domain-containing protein [Phycisphaerae bacterium]